MKCAWSIPAGLGLIIILTAFQNLFTEAYGPAIYYLAGIFFILIVVVIPWRITLSKTRNSKLSSGSWRFGTFITEHYLLHRKMNSKNCHVLAKGEIRSIELIPGRKYNPPSFWFNLKNGKRKFLPIAQTRSRAQTLAIEIRKWLN